jgi:1,2-diacylglycerol 3-beta-galactosyltransferase
MATRVFIAMSDTGGGHRAISNAVRDSIHRMYGDSVETTISDVFALGRRTVFDDATRLYNPVLRHAPWLYGWVYHLSNKRHVYSTLARQVELLDTPKIRRALAAAKPDVIVSIHPLSNRPIIKARAALGWDTPIVAVVTELVTVHRSWVDPGIDLYTTATPETQAAVIGMGANPRRVFQIGLPVDERFGNIEESPAEIRRRYGLDPDRFTVMLSGGGEGAGGLGRMISAADRAGIDAQFLIVCGRNGRLKNRLESKHLRVPNRVFGFVDNMPELVHAADVVVTKGGPGSISEALAGKRPVILTAITPGQEEGNDQFVERYGVGFAPRSTAGVVESLRMLAGHPEQRARLARNAARLSRPGAAADAGRLIIETARRPDFQPLLTV